MKSKEELVEWARKHADQLKLDMRWTEGHMSGGWWTSDGPESKTIIMARATAALEFFNQYAGSESQWMHRAKIVYETRADNESIESGARALGDMLTEWASQVESGMVDVPGAFASDVRSVASVDLMTQVRMLNEDKSVTPAAPIVLAGAALEIALRAAVDEKQLTLTEKPSISAYGRLLRTSGVLSVQEMKDVDQMGGLRNAAAHGEFDTLSRERSGLMEQQVNWFLSRLSTILDA